MSLSYLALYFILAFIGGNVLQKLRVPGGMMVGATVACATANLLFGLGAIPPLIKILAQVLTGVYIGINIDSDELKSLKHIIKPFIIIMAGLFISNLISGYLIAWLSPLDLLTALLAVTPGGLNNIPLMAPDMGADPLVVTVLQSARMIIGVGIFPSLIEYLAKNRQEAGAAVQNRSRQPAIAGVKLSRVALAELGAFLGIAYFVGWLGSLIDFPAAYLIFPILICIAIKFKRKQARAPITLRKAAQLLTGVYLGNNFTRNDIATLKYLWLPLLIMVAFFVVTFLISGSLINNKKYFGFSESMFAALPVGASDMALMTADLGIENTNLNLLHVIRLLAVILSFPFIWQWLANVLPLVK